MLYYCCSVRTLSVRFECFIRLFCPPVCQVVILGVVSNFEASMNFLYQLRKDLKPRKREQSEYVYMNDDAVNR